MKTHRDTLCQAACIAVLVSLTAVSGSYAAPAGQIRRDVIEVAQAPDSAPRELEPRYQPVPPQEKSWYNSSYLFGATRGVAGSTMVPAAKVSLFLLTVPFDLVTLPIAAIGGLFG